MVEVSFPTTIGPERSEFSVRSAEIERSSTLQQRHGPSPILIGTIFELLCVADELGDNNNGLVFPLTVP